MNNEYGAGATRYLSVRRIFNKLLQWVARRVFFLPSEARVTLQRWRGVKFVEPKTVFLAEDVYFDDLYPQLVTVGRDVVITSGVRILTHYINTEFVPEPGRRYGFYQGEVMIGDDVFIGMNTVVAKPVAIGNGAVVGANSVITTDIQEYTLVGGVPARLIRKRFEKYNKNPK